MDFTPTNIPAENQYPKLVRDRIPEILEKKGLKIKPEVLKTDAEYLKFLLAKMIEEAAELSHSEEVGNMQEELADIFELIYAILKLKGWSIEQIIEVQKQKREKNGGFDQRIILLEKP